MEKHILIYIMVEEADHNDRILLLNDALKIFNDSIHSRGTPKQQE